MRSVLGVHWKDWCWRWFSNTLDDQLSGWTKQQLQSTSQSQIYTKKRSQSLFGGLLPIWSTTAFWILMKPLDLRSMLSKLMRCTENCNACIQHATERVQFFSTKTPKHTSYHHRFKVEQIGIRVLPHLPYSPNLMPTDNHFKHLNNFLWGKRFYNQQGAENVF